MSRLYEILKKLEQRKGTATVPGHIPRQEVPKSKRKLALLVCIFLLSFLLGFGGFYAFKAFLSPPGSHLYSLPPVSKRKPSVSLSHHKLTKETPRVSSKSPPSTPKPKPKHIKTAKSGPTGQATLTTKPEKTTTSPKPPQNRPVYALAKTNPASLRPKHEATQETTHPKYRKELIGPYPPLKTKEILRGLLVRAESLRKEGRCEKAVKLYREYLKHQKDAAVLNNYGACLLLLGDIEEAERAFSQSLKLANDPSTRLNLVIAKIKNENFSEACSEFHRIKDYSSPLYREVSQILKTRCR